jgi:hypothetical protein
MISNNRSITNVDELRAEISRLKLLQKEQESYLNDQFILLQDKVESPIRFVNNLTSWFPKINPKANSFGSTNADSDWVTNSLRVGLPFLFNKVLFRKAGFIKKALLLVATQKMAGGLNQDKITKIIDKITDIIRPKTPKTNKTTKDYGIPPDSETY